MTKSKSRREYADAEMSLAALQRREAEEREEARRKATPAKSLVEAMARESEA